MKDQEASYHVLDEASYQNSTYSSCHKLKHAKRTSDILACAFALALLIQSIAVWLLPNRIDTCKCHFKTDFEGIQSKIGYEERQFSGWEWDDEYKFIKRPVDLTKTQLFGDPRVIADMDKNWNSLLEVQFFALSEKESQLYPDIQPMPQSGYKYMELDVTHKLHCVNQLRKMLYYHYYDYKVHPLQRWHAPPEFYLEHMNHCLENLFDGIICHSDLTPAPVHSYPSFTPNVRNSSFSVSGTHTCRSFDQVREWLYERAKQRPSLTSQGRIYQPGS